MFDIWLTVGLGDPFGLRFLGEVLFLILWMVGSAALLALVVIWADRGSRNQLLVAVVGSLVYAAFTTYLYLGLTSGDPMAGFALITVVPGQWLIVGLVAFVVRVMSPIAWDPVSTAPRTRP